MTMSQAGKRAPERPHRQRKKSAFTQTRGYVDMWTGGHVFIWSVNRFICIQASLSPSCRALAISADMSTCHHANMSPCPHVRISSCLHGSLCAFLPSFSRAMAPARDSRGVLPAVRAHAPAFAPLRYLSPPAPDCCHEAFRRRARFSYSKMGQARVSGAVTSRAPHRAKARLHAASRKQRGAFLPARLHADMPLWS